MPSFKTITSSILAKNMAVASVYEQPPTAEIIDMREKESAEIENWLLKNFIDKDEFKSKIIQIIEADAGFKTWLINYLKVDLAADTTFGTNLTLNATFMTALYSILDSRYAAKLHTHP